ncbi:TPA: hypothetical protein ACE78E_001830, partial [Neisseria gonorrhoeae]
MVAAIAVIWGGLLLSL